MKIRQFQVFEINGGHYLYALGENGFLYSKQIDAFGCEWEEDGDLPDWLVAMPNKRNPAQSE